MKISFEGPAIFVKDIQQSRHFYEKLLKQEVLADFGENIPFKSGFSLWQAGHATEVIFSGKQKTPTTLSQNNFEMYFECAELDTIWAKVEAEWDAIIHPIHEAPWGQRGFRLHDPDGHIVEIGEPLATLFTRLLDEGMTPEGVAQRVGVPVEMVKGLTEN